MLGFFGEPLFAVDLAEDVVDGGQIGSQRFGFFQVQLRVFPIVQSKISIAEAFACADFIGRNLHRLQQIRNGLFILILAEQEIAEVDVGFGSF